MVSRDPGAPGERSAGREDAIGFEGYGFFRWLGFARIGGSIAERARSIINGLVREGRLEAKGGEVRKAWKFPPPQPSPPRGGSRKSLPVGRRRGEGAGKVCWWDVAEGREPESL